MQPNYWVRVYTEKGISEMAGHLARPLIIMGVCGSGKSTVGRALATCLKADFLDADDFHPAENIRKMQAGVPLTEDDRVPWLRRLASVLASYEHRQEGVVLACSALTNGARTILTEQAPAAIFIFLEGSEELLRERLNGRRDHFMPASLLDSQLATLEPPETAVRINIAAPVSDIVGEVHRELKKLGCI